MDRLAGTLLGTAVGDALGLATEGMSARAIARRFGRVDRYRVLPGVGLVSDDTELSALVAAALVRSPRDVDGCVRVFRWSLLLWFLRLPLGIGLATLRACVKIGLGFPRSGVVSAGNGAAMRAAIVGVFFRDDAERRLRFSDALATVTHLDPRGVEGARFVAALAASCARSVPSSGRVERVREALAEIADARLRAAIERACDVAASAMDVQQASDALGNTGFVMHCVPLATFVFLRFGDDPREAVIQAVAAGGDTDSNAAIVGAWVGALHGASGLPAELVSRLQSGPFGAAHLRRLAACLVEAGAGRDVAVPRLGWVVALARNVALVPVVLAHAVRVVITR